MKVSVLYFVTDKLVKLTTMNVNMATGTAKFGKHKEFSFDKSKPLSLEVGKFRKKIVPFYILKHNIHKPLEVRFVTEKGRKDAEMVVTPENFKNMMTQGTLNTLLTLSNVTTTQMFLWIIIGAVMGLLAGLLIPWG